MKEEPLLLARPHWAEPPQVRVVLRKRIRGATSPEALEEEVVWPRGWPLPDAGMIVLGKAIGGWVEHVELDAANERILVVLRPQ